MTFLPRIKNSSKGQKVGAFAKVKNEDMPSRQSGQIVVEYILLLMVAVGVAALITNTMVSRSEDSPGFLILKWDQIIRTIGEDPIEE